MIWFEQLRLLLSRLIQLRDRQNLPCIETDSEVEIGTLPTIVATARDTINAEFSDRNSRQMDNSEAVVRAICFTRANTTGIDDIDGGG